MTTNMRNAIEQAAYEIGVATAKYEMLVGDPRTIIKSAPVLTPMAKADIHPTLKSTALPKAPNPSKIARGVKKAAGPRTPGVKKGIMNLISSTAMSTAEIIGKTGFNDNSVRATLMSLKKAGLAMNDDGLWIASSHSGDGNSETALEDARY